MKSVELTVQEKRDYCVCSVLQAILRRHGLEISQREIARNLTRGKNDDGKKDGYIIHDGKIKEFLLGKGFAYTFFYAHTTPFNEPDELLKEMCKHDGIIGMRVLNLRDKKKYDHVYFLKDFKDPTLKLVDPKNGQEIEKDYFELLREMEYDDVFGLIKKI